MSTHRNLLFCSTIIAAMCVSRQASALCYENIGRPGRPASAALGTTPEEVHNNFRVFIRHNFQVGDASKIVANLSGNELADLARLYTASNGGRVDDLLNILAAKLDAPALRRIANAFGKNNVQHALEIRASTHVKDEYDKFNLDATENSLVTPVILAAPTPDMTLPEIYLEFRTAPVGNLSPASALAEAAMYAGARLVWSAGLGYAIGTEINNLITEYDPSLEDAIGGTVVGVVENIHSAADELSQGRFEQGLDDLFGGPIQDSGDLNGDYSVSESMDDYMGGNGGECW